MTSRDGDEARTPGLLPEAQAVPEIIDAAQLFRGASEVIIRHAGQNYRLRVTRANKLLLIK